MTTGERPQRVSVAMATYNGTAHIRAQLDSIAWQTELPDELVISDDGSSDETLAIVRAFAAGAPFDVRILPPGGRLGFADNFLRCAEACRFPLVALADQDDVWLPTKLAVSRRRIETDDSLLAMHRLLETDALLQPRQVWTQGIVVDAVYAPTELDPFRNGWGNSMVFRRELVQLIARDQRPRQPEAPERALSHDTWIYCLAAALGRVSHITEPLVLYRQHDHNAMGLRDKLAAGLLRRQLDRTSKLRERFRFYERMQDLLDELGMRSGNPFAQPARLAAGCYAGRAQPIRERCAVYDGPTLRARLRSFSTLRRGARISFSSAVRHLALGVSGLERALLQTRLALPLRTRGGLSSS